MSNAKYDNCEIYSKEDKFLGYCDKKKFDWYIKKDIVTVIGEKAIKLKFEPKINGKDGKFEEYCKVEMKTQCVVCSNNKKLNKFHVIPSEFRKFFPLHMKSHASHDVVLICKPCHNEVNGLYGEYRDFLLHKYKLEVNQDSAKIKACVNQLLKFVNKTTNKYNKKKMQYNEDFISKYLGHPYTKEDLENLKDICVYDNLPTNMSIGEYIVAQNKNNLEKFAEDWRKMFVEHMEPKFLPECW